MLRNFFRARGRLQSIRIKDFAAQSIAPGDDLLLSCAQFPADVDAVGFLNTLQAQFPGVRLHLLLGFPSVEVVRGQNADKRSDDASPKGSIEERVEQAFKNGAPAGPQGNVVICTWAAGGRVVLVSVPPQAGNSVAESHGGERTATGDSGNSK